MTSFLAFRRAVAHAPRAVQFWWRDDDAHRPDPQLDALLHLSKTHQVPVSLAVVPSWIQDGFADTLAPHTARVTCLQHGHAHANHAEPPARKCEYPETRSRTEVRSELQHGAQLLRQRVGTLYQPVFVPPWNRMSPVHYEAMQAAQLTGFSARFNNEPAPGLHNLPVDIDIIDWQSRCFRGTDACVGALVKALSTHPERPIGIMTHHLDHDDACWAFLDELFFEIGAMSGARVVCTRERLGA
ncbi:MAG: hypothetical protein AAF460_08195 [Pseudomonadota bacterium]